MPATQRTTIRGPAFIRQLARLTDADTPPPRPSLSDRLSQWLDWTHAIALATALDGKPPAPPAEAPVFDGDEEGECAQLRAALAQAIAGDRAFAAAGQDGPGEEAAADYSFFRQRYQALQRRMDTHIGDLRSRLRDRLALGTAQMARLASVDAVMERALGPRERGLLAAVPGLLGEHFERLRRAAQEAAEDDTPAATAGAWLDNFRTDMRNVALAELEVRLQPVEGLLAALRTR